VDEMLHHGQIEIKEANMLKEEIEHKLFHLNLN
jgi:hypothetical protein